MTKNLTFLNFFKNLSKWRAKESVQTLSSSAGELQVNKGYGLRPLRGPSEGRKEPKMAKIIKILSFSTFICFKADGRVYNICTLLIKSSFHSFIHPVFQLLVHSFIHPFIHSFTYTFNVSLIDEKLAVAHTYNLRLATGTEQKFDTEVGLFICKKSKCLERPPIR